MREEVERSWRATWAAEEEPIGGLNGDKGGGRREEEQRHGPGRGGRGGPRWQETGGTTDGWILTRIIGGGSIWPKRDSKHGAG